jgi:hypothetical protein
VSCHNYAITTPHFDGRSPEIPPPELDDVERIAPTLEETAQILLCSSEGRDGE